MKNHHISHNKKTKNFSQKRIAQIIVVTLLWFLWAVFSPEMSITPSNSDVILDTKKPFRKDDQIRVLSWNLHNYNLIERWHNNKYQKLPKPEPEKESLYKIISQNKPDIILIQEIGDITYLKELQNKLIDKGLVYPYATLTSHDAPIRLAILSRIEILKTYDFSDTFFYFDNQKVYSNRGALGAKFSSENIDWYVFTLHLKSPYGAGKADEKFIPYRFAELRAIDNRISNAIGNNAPILIAGDFNQEPSTALLRNFKHLNLNLLEQSDSVNQKYTYWWRKRDIYYQYDYFLYSKEISKYISGNATVVEDTQSASDHRPVYVDVDF